MPAHGEVRNRGGYGYGWPLPPGSERFCLICNLWMPVDSYDRRCGECDSFWFGSPRVPRPDEAAYLLAVMESVDQYKTWKTVVKNKCLGNRWVENSYLNTWSSRASGLRLTEVGVRALELYTARPGPKPLSIKTPEEDFFGSQDS